jgi:hypothetical protein
VRVTATLCLTAREAMMYFQDFWKLKRQYELYQIYPEIQHSLPSFLKLFKELKRQGLTPQNVKWYVDCLNIGTLKMEDIEADYEDAKANNQNLLTENENLRYEKLSLQYENQELVRQIEYNRQVFENQSKAMQQYISNLSNVQEQQQQNVEMLSTKIAKLGAIEQKQRAAVSRFKDTKNYRKIEGIAQKQIRNYLTVNEANYPKKSLITFALQAVLGTLREQPNRYNIIFNDNSPIISNEYQETIITMTQTFGRTY